MHVIAGKAVCFGEALQPEFKALRSGRSSPTPRRWPKCCCRGGLKLVSGGTDNHLMLVDVTALGVGGKLAETVLDRCGITVNMNMIPFDDPQANGPQRHPHRHAGPDHPRHGRSEMKSIGGWILGALKSADDEATHAGIRGEVSSLCSQFPVPAEAAVATV